MRSHSASSSRYPFQAFESHDGAISKAEIDVARFGMVAPGEQSEEARLFHDMARENTRDRSFYDPEFVFSYVQYGVGPAAG